VAAHEHDHEEEQEQPRSRWAMQLGLFLLTCVSTTLAGVGIAHSIPFTLIDFVSDPPFIVAGLVVQALVHRPALLLDGLGFSLPLMSIFLTHEMGHYLTARYYRVPASLPYFIPLPLGLGTLGAVIGMRPDANDRRVMLEIGAAGPLAGFVVAFVVLLLGFSWSDVKSAAELAVLAQGGGIVVEGDSLIYAFARWLVHGSLEPGADVWIHPTAWAGWVGLYLTWFNLQPFSQFDGGHVAAAVFGKRARWLSLSVFLYLPLLFVFTFNAFWLVLAVIMALIGRGIGYTHPPLYDERPLQRRQVIIAVLCALLFVTTVVPNPWHADERFVVEQSQEELEP